MRSKLRLAASLLATVALALIGATAVVAGNPHTTYTCTKPKKNGETEVRVSVPEPSVGGLTNAGFTCVTEAPASEDEDEDEGQATDTGPGNDSTPEQDSEPETTDEGPLNDSMPEQDPEPKAEEHSSPTVTVEAPSESRSLYCSTNGPVERSNAEGSGVALNLPDSQGALLVEMGLATPAIFYAGIGVSCDLLPGFTYSGVWVDHIGDVAPGVAVYPYYIPTTS
jgi:hypothetical protein